MAYLRSQIAKLANINIETLRYYEKLGLIPAPKRSEKGYRLYNDDVLNMLETIKYAKYCGLSLEEIKEIISLFYDINNVDYNSVIKVVDQKVDWINNKVSELNKMKDVLLKIKDNINSNIQCPIKKSFLKI
jgi:DNA-binding transcriptional MerR regulator